MEWQTSFKIAFLFFFSLLKTQFSNSTCCLAIQGAGNAAKLKETIALGNPWAADPTH